jgi:hypothetical protein
MIPIIFNKKFLLYFIFALFAVGNYLPFFGINGLRIFVVILSLLIIISGMKQKLTFSYPLRVYFFLVFIWLSWGFIGLFFQNDFVSSAKELFCLFFGLLFGLVLTMLIKGNKKLIKTLAYSWVLAYLIIFSVCLWEIFFGQHLESSIGRNSPAYFMEILWLTSTLDNSNNLAAFLILTFPFLVYAYTLHDKLIHKTILAFLISTLPILMILTASRGGLLGFFIEALLFISLRWNGFNSKIFFGGLILGVFMVISSVSSFSNEQSSFLLARRLTSFQGQFQDTSFIERFHQSLDGLYMALASYGLGVGPNGFKDSLNNLDVPYELITPAPHNFWIEIISQYGVFVFILFTHWFFLIVFLHYRKFKREQNLSIRNLHKILFIGSIGYLFASLENSTYISEPTNWLFIASLLALTEMSLCRDL